MGTIDAHNSAMTSNRALIAMALAMLAGCYEADQPSQYSTFPQPTQMQGPPGGGMDPQAGYQQPGSQDPNLQYSQYAGDPNTQAQQPIDPNSPNGNPNAQVQPYADPNDPNAQAIDPNDP